jgi:hypothetical protein
MPEEFRGTYQAIVAEFWAPMMMHEQVRPTGTQLTQRGWGWLSGYNKAQECAPSVIIDTGYLPVKGA